MLLALGKVCLGVHQQERVFTNACFYPLPPRQFIISGSVTMGAQKKPIRYKVCWNVWSKNAKCKRIAWHKLRRNY